MALKQASSPAQTPLRLLLVEDREADAEAILRELRKNGFNPQCDRVATREALEDRLHGQLWDLVIGSTTVPGLSALDALEQVRGRSLDLPFIIVSGGVSEDVVSEVMRAGAQDFISKGSLLRLVPAIRRELQDLAVRRERKRVATRLAESEGRYACLFQENPSPMLLVEAATLMIVDANPSAAAFLGHSIEVLERATIAALTCNPGMEGWKRLQRMKEPEGLRFQDRMRMADGRVVDVEISAVLIPQRGRALLLATIHDQTGLKAAEHRMDRMAAALEEVTDGIVCMDSQGGIIYTNPAFARLVGMDAAHVLGRRLQDLIAVPRLAEGVALVGRGKAWDARFTFSPSGEHRDLRATLSPIRSLHGEDPGSVAVVRDITHGVALDQQMRQAEKMDALGTLAAGISHDFNNVLTTILSAAELIKTKLPDDSPILPKIDAILHAGLCASGLNRQILSFSRKTEEKKLPVDLTATLKDALQMLRATLPSGVDIQSEITSGLWVESDPAQLQHLVINLGINAFRSLPHQKGLIEITLSEVAPQSPGLPVGLENHRCAVLRVRDTGSGIDPAVLGRIFEPFFTTRREGEGTGLGLAMVHATVTQSGGRISVSSELGVGTVFTIHIPCALGHERPTEDRLPEDVGGVERILLVEDEELVAALAKQGLQSLGYRVTTMNHPLEALEEFRRDPDRYDLVLMDLAMPEMNGADLTGKLQEIRPGLLVILVTGLPPATALTLNARATFRGVVAKPFTAYELARAIRRALVSVRKTPPATRPLSSSAGFKPSGAEILLAEDSFSTRAMIQSWLEQEGYRVQVAKDGMDAWERFDQGQTFDLLLTDFVMPRMDGLELAQLVRNADPSIPIAMLTSSGDQDTVKSALHLGVKEYLNKPFQKPELIKCVKHLLDERMSMLAARRSVETAQAVRLAQRALVATPEKGLPLYSLYEPLTDAGGDIFRCLRCVDGSILFVLADVAGHSVASSYAVASFLTMLSTFISGCGELKGLVKGEYTCREDRHCPFAHLGRCQPLQHLALKFNKSIQEGPFSEVPVCALLGHWEPATGRLQLLNAGIPHALLYNVDRQEVQSIPINGTPLGIFDEPMLEERVIQLLPGDRVLLGTDGFFDITSPEGALFQDSAPEHWLALKDTPMDWALSVVCEAARCFGNGVIADDLMVVAFEQPVIEKKGMVLRLPSTPESVDRIVGEMDALIRAAGLSFRDKEARLFDIGLAVREALTNAICHGNANRADAWIGFRCDLDAEGILRVVVTDEGSGFDLTTYEAPKDPLSERGRGIPLIQHFAQQIEMKVGEFQMVFPLKERAHDNC